MYKFSLKNTFYSFKNRYVLVELSSFRQQEMNDAPQHAGIPAFVVNKIQRAITIKLMSKCC